MEEVLSVIERNDPEIARAVRMEMERERSRINLIASENYAPAAVLAAQGSILTNKYAEGYPGARYYSGCEPADLAERLAVSRAKELFGSAHANVQPHAGAQANMAVYMTALRPGETIMAMDLRCGGHLTHGAPANFSGRLYRSVHYGVDPETETLDYDAISRLAEAEKPRLIVAGASAYPRTIDFARFRRIADSVGAFLMVDMAHFAGLVVGGVHPDPVPHAEFVTGTTHKTMRGPRGGYILCAGEHREKIDSAVFPGMQGGPLMHVVAAKAVCFKLAMEPEFKEYQRTVVANAGALCDRIAADGFRIVSGGTDTHLFLVDLTARGISGRQAQDALDSVGINVNMNEIPYDSKPPTVTSGIRIGTPAVTTRGMKPEHMETLGELISRVLTRVDDRAALERARREAGELIAGFPVG